MKNIYINQAESIFEAFWDGGDSYMDNEKYCSISQYRQDGQGSVQVVWNGVRVFSEENFRLSREFVLDIEDFDRLILRAGLPKGMELRVHGTIDGVNTEILTSDQDLTEFEGHVHGKHLTRVEMEFINKGDCSAPVHLYWLGLANSKKREKMLAEKNGYGKDCWEGCFQENYQIKLHLSAYFNEEQLGQIRAKAHGEYAELFHKLEEEAQNLMKYEIEQYIGEYIDFTNTRFGRKRDFDKDVPPFTGMAALAFVGLINKDANMLKMACRYALSASCCTYWCEGIMGVFPGAAWHHRSFLEGVLCVACAKVLAWAGELLTWHGRNIIYNAIIMKGLPRLEADIYTMDYIWHMNQGIVFTSNLLLTLLVLKERYPRYTVQIDRYEKALLEMWNNYVNEDGGTGEGPKYWDYSAVNFLWCMYQLAGYRGKRLEEYLGEILDTSESYVRGTMSTVNEGIYLIPVNDCHSGKCFTLLIPAFFLAAGKDKAFWVDKFMTQMRSGKELGWLQELMMLSKDLEIEKQVETSEEYREEAGRGICISLVHTGIFSLVRNSEDIGKTALFVQCGKPEKGHEHEDKGSFILEADGEELVIDRGVCNYGNSNEYDFSTAKWHNLLYPECDREMHQLKGDEQQQAHILDWQYEDDIFMCRMDLTNVWDGAFARNIRTVLSANPGLYIIYDDIQTEYPVSFRLNTRGEIKEGVVIGERSRIYVHPVNWQPERVVGIPEGTDSEGRPVNQLRLYSGAGDRPLDGLITVLELTTGESRFKAEDIDWKQKKIMEGRL